MFKPSLKTLLWILSAVQILKAIPGITILSGSRICTWVYGQESCNPAETIYLNYNALWDLHVGVMLGSLLSASSSNVEFLRDFGLLAVASEFAGTAMFGSALVDGTMETAIHFVSLLANFVMMMLLMTTHANPDSRSIMTGNGWMKIYLLVTAFYCALWIFVNSDAQECTEVMLEASDFSSMAKMQWNWWSIGTLEIFLLMVTAAYRGNLRHQTAICHSLVALQLVSIWVVWKLKPITTMSIYLMTSASFVLMLVFAVAAAFKDNRPKEKAA